MALTQSGNSTFNRALQFAIAISICSIGLLTELYFLMVYSTHKDLAMPDLVTTNTIKSQEQT